MVKAKLGKPSEMRLIQRICIAVNGKGKAKRILPITKIISLKASLIKYKIILRIFSNICRPSRIAATIVEKFESSKIRSADSFATSVASLTTTPISAWWSAGASFTPSPNIATTSPLAFKAATIFIFWSGELRANKRS
ncbi:hypothetical protein SDC9_151124 [bioreactor metagenome]|uniref:Uncharacterized protein n=1 Tax=bioreactor metagenome TaxID=1076179 RepID=A0A645ERT7_9ZZZZ